PGWSCRRWGSRPRPDGASASSGTPRSAPRPRAASTSVGRAMPSDLVEGERRGDLCLTLGLPLLPGLVHAVARRALLDPEVLGGLAPGVPLVVAVGPGLLAQLRQARAAARFLLGDPVPSWPVAPSPRASPC